MATDRRIRITSNDINRFFKKVYLGLGESACWAWLGGLNMATGRGTFWIDGDTRCASRVAYRMYFGDFPNQLYVCHHCDNPNCVNPKHLFLGTNSDNQKDMYAKGLRCVKGENAFNSKLTNRDARKIRKLYSLTTLSQKAIADIYGVSKGAIQHVVRYRTFKEA